MIEHPKLKTYLTVFPTSDHTWGLRGGTDELWRIELSDPRAVEALGALLPFLDGQHRSEEILTTLEQRGIERRIVQQILQHLETSALIEEIDTAGLSPDEAESFADQITFFSRFSTGGGCRYQKALRDSRVAVAGSGRLGRSLCRQLVDAGFGEVVVLVSEPPTEPWIAEETKRAESTGTRLEALELDPDTLWPDPERHPLPALLLMAQQTNDPKPLEAADAWSKRHRLPWLLVRAVDAREGWVGPLFLPGETACYLSLDARLRGNLPFYDEHRAFDEQVRASGHRFASLGGLPSFFDLLAGIGVTEAIKLVSEIDVPYLAGRFLAINLWSWQVETHDVLRVPGIDPFADPEPTVFPWKETEHAGDRTTSS
jgi:bacteriocin biosynthesis cyclodehydratase domain-containing protein